MFIEYRIQELDAHSILLCKIKGRFNNDMASKGFLKIFSVVNRIMSRKQLLNIKKLSENLAAGKVCPEFAAVAWQPVIHSFTS
jgi:hypothetical protein